MPIALEETGKVGCAYKAVIGSTVGIAVLRPPIGIHRAIGIAVSLGKIQIFCKLVAAEIEDCTRDNCCTIGRGLCVGSLSVICRTGAGLVRCAVQAILDMVKHIQVMDLDQPVVIVVYVADIWYFITVGVYQKRPACSLVGIHGQLAGLVCRRLVAISLPGSGYVAFTGLSGECYLCTFVKFDLAFALYFTFFGTKFFLLVNNLIPLV